MTITHVKAHDRRTADKPLDPFHQDIQLLVARRRSAAVERDVMQAVETLQRFQERVATRPEMLAGATEGLI
ncbi:hypothetical protein AKG11_32710 [Shinella sp. SUS2]|uniref:hypothetical protein n=1 Tax=unclassified Shinella TaxID=2643062 RepID=UPI000680D01B|nr:MULTISPECIES: hypothetical protein [unclassified Shinella]KNY11864.1 hypothetical protein AKG11_32710 [Shinella sp. SUS2]KOC71544.1 hypothetical protein AKG10_32375 [Shinella sp. GWS1]